MDAPSYLRRSLSTRSRCRRSAIGLPALFGRSLFGRALFGRALFGLLCTISIAPEANAVGVATQHFLVDAPTQQLAKTVAGAAEKYRHDLAMHWLGEPLPPWSGKCRIHVVAGNYPAQGVTQYNPQPVRDFNMEVVGTPQRILDSVLPHEITHTVLATHFGRPVPRWADEGICTTVEHPDEKNKHEVKLREFLNTRRGIPMNKLFLLKEYPADILPMYAQGYSVVRFLIEQQGPRTFVNFLGDYMNMARPSWTQNIRKHYGYESLAELQQHWVAWVGDGSGPVDKYVKADTQTGPAQGLVAQTGATSPSGRPRPADPPSIRLAAANSNGPSAGKNWYARNRDQPTGGSTSDSRGAAPERLPRGSTPLASTANPASDADSTMPSSIKAPPSVTSSSVYSSAHPQPEQRMARGGAPIGQPAQRRPASQPGFDPAATRYWR